ncbi:MBL fold metallo-hydrolase [Halalkalibaculum sp. DA3122]|uniref:MBL fold metallo-hydrolase n=1 Tax=unclassified Halalkalibaculum TaxID=2964617 RepID=UPI0037540B46
MSEKRINKKVFLVSESPSDLTVLTRAIEESGLRLIKDRNSDNEELVNRIRTSHPDLVFWDSRAFATEAISIIQALRDNAETESMPVYLFQSARQGVNAFPAEFTSFEQVTVLDENIDAPQVRRLLNGVLKPSLAVKLWGVRGSTPCANKENIVYGGNTTCVQVELPFTDELLILDSGTGIRNLGNYLSAFREEVTGNIFITHPHWDHIQGFPFFKPIYSAENHFAIHMPPQATGGCREILSGHLSKTFFPVTLDMFDASLEYVTQDTGKQEGNGYSIEYMLANHPINTAIYKLKAAGKTIVFAPDNELQPIDQKSCAFFYEKFREFIRDADILIHDAQYDKISYRSKVGWGHSAWETTVDFARRAGVKNLLLTHHDPDSDDTYLAELDEKIERKFGEYFESVQLAKEGTKVKLEVRDQIRND